ncbi:hypothetical protein [Candidatus Protofrankia datiscae]|uniref:Uncharacterized protein n=2 Tax=Protofrankia TaxID=2994361 RepID=F8B1N2_9ACTN|nr:hypothetical protein [Candidatus Protofrankia datiscae]AEH08007.1 hypothetical protein FsymDg_0458 [Candidatus Protofrankia datiscae]
MTTTDIGAGVRAARGGAGSTPTPGLDPGPRDVEPRGPGPGSLPPRARPTRARRWPAALAVLVAFCGLSVLLFRDGWTDLGGTVYGGGDAVLFSWYLGWTPYALTHGLNPFVTQFLNAPDGVNIMWSTGVPLLGVLAAPITMLAGPLVTFHVLTTLAPALSGWAMFLAVRRWTAALPAAVAGLLYGFGPYLIGASYGHLHLSFVPFPPILLLLMDDLLVRQRNIRRTGVLLGVAVAAQALISEEVLATSAVVAVVAIAILCLQYRDQVRARAGAAIRGLAICAGVAAAALAWPLATQFFGPQRVHGSIQPPDVAVSDLLTFVTPTPLQAFGPDFAVRESLTFTGNAVEVSGYLGLPLLALLLFIAVRLRRNRLVALCAPLAVVAAVLSLGPHLHVGGHNTGIPLPWRVLELGPVLHNALPSRLSLYVVLAAGIMIAIWLDQARPPRLRAVTIGVSVVALVPLVPASLLAFSPATPAFFTGSQVSNALPGGSTALVVPYPYPQQNVAMLWQAQADFRFAIPGCYCTVPDRNGRSSFHPEPDPLNSALIAVATGASTADDALRQPGLRATFDRFDLDAVILGPSDHRDELVKLLTELAGGPGRHVDGVDLWLLDTP